MIRGVVNDRHEAVVRLRVRGPVGLWLDVNAIVDTGFSASLTLPDATAAFLGLARLFSSGAVMADGTVGNFDVYPAEVEWADGWRPVLVSAIGDEVLIGLQLLAGSELKVAVIPGGAVEIAPLP